MTTASFFHFLVIENEKQKKMQRLQTLPIAVIGAGPVGLAAAAHLQVPRIPFLLFEAASTVASNILSWKHIRVSSPWKYNINNAARQLLNEARWESPDDEGLPNGEELYNEYFKAFNFPFWKLQIASTDYNTSLVRSCLDVVPLNLSYPQAVRGR